MQGFPSLDTTGQINFFPATSVLYMSMLKNLINSWGIEQVWVFEEQAYGEENLCLQPGVLSHSLPLGTCWV